MLLWLLHGIGPRWKRCCKVKLCVGGARELHCCRESKDHYYKRAKRIVIVIRGTRGPEWPRPHDCTNFVWDEFKFIPIIGSATSIEAGSFFFPSLTSRLPIKKIYSIAQAFQTPTTYLCPTKNPKPRRHLKVKAVLLKMMLQRRCWSDAIKDGVVEMVLKCYCKRWSCKSSVEVMLQKTMLQKRCWNGVVEDDITKAMLKQCCRRWCCRNGVEVVCRKRC